MSCYEIEIGDGPGPGPELDNLNYAIIQMGVAVDT